MVSTGNGELGLIPEREPEKRLPHPRKAAGSHMLVSKIKPCMCKIGIVLASVKNNVNL